MPRVALDDNQRMNLWLRPEQKAMLMRAAAEVGGVVLIMQRTTARPGGTPTTVLCL